MPDIAVFIAQTPLTSTVARALIRNKRTESLFAWSRGLAKRREISESYTIND